MRDLEVRLADPGDAAAIAELHARSFATAYEHLPLTRRSAVTELEHKIAFWESRLGRLDEATLVAVEAGTVIAFVHFGPTPDPDGDDATGHIFSVHVEPSLAGSGVGGRLVEDAVRSLGADGYDTVTLWAVGENERAQRFYARHGWRADGATRVEKLAIGGEDGDEVEVVRFARDLVGVPEGS